MKLVFLLLLVISLVNAQISSSLSISNSVTPSVTKSSSITVSISESPSSSISKTPSISESSTSSLSESSSVTPSPSISESSSASISLSITLSKSVSTSATLSKSASVSLSRTISYQNALSNYSETQTNYWIIVIILVIIVGGIGILPIIIKFLWQTRCCTTQQPIDNTEIQNVRIMIESLKKQNLNTWGYICVQWKLLLVLGMTDLTGLSSNTVDTLSFLPLIGCSGFSSVSVANIVSATLYFISTFLAGLIIHLNKKKLKFQLHTISCFCLILKLLFEIIFSVNKIFIMQHLNYGLSITMQGLLLTFRNLVNSVILLSFFEELRYFVQEIKEISLPFRSKVLFNLGMTAIVFSGIWFGTIFFILRVLMEFCNFETVNFIFFILLSISTLIGLVINYSIIRENKNRNCQMRDRQNYGSVIESEIWENKYIAWMVAVFSSLLIIFISLIGEVFSFQSLSWSEDAFDSSIDEYCSGAIPHYILLNFFNCLFTALCSFGLIFSISMKRRYTWWYAGITLVLGCLGLVCQFYIEYIQDYLYLQIPVILFLKALPSMFIQFDWFFFMSVLNLGIFHIGQAIISGIIVVLPSFIQLLFQFALRNVVLGLLIGFAFAILLKTLKTSISQCKYRELVEDEETEESPNANIEDEMQQICCDETATLIERRPQVEIYRPPFRSTQ